MKRLFWSRLWLGVTAALAGCYGNMNPGADTSPISAPPDTALGLPTKWPPLPYHSQPHLPDRAQQPLPTRPDTNVISRVWMLGRGRVGRLVPYRSDTSTLAARRARTATARRARAATAPPELPPIPLSRTADTSAALPGPEPAPPTAATSPAAPARTLAGALSGLGSENVRKVRVQRDGDIKIKDKVGNKLKLDADDGTLKQKPVWGGKQVIR